MMRQQPRSGPRVQRRLVDHRGRDGRFAGPPTGAVYTSAARARRRRRLGRRATAWTVLLVVWLAATVGVGIAGWWLVGPASLCCPILMAAVLVMLACVVWGDLREQRRTGRV